MHKSYWLSSYTFENLRQINVDKGCFITCMQKPVSNGNTRDDDKKWVRCNLFIVRYNLSIQKIPGPFPWIFHIFNFKNIIISRNLGNLVHISSHITTMITLLYLMIKYGYQNQMIVESCLIIWVIGTFLTNSNWELFSKYFWLPFAI